MNILRHQKNPIITIKDVKPSSPQMNIIGVFNCGVVEYDNEILLLLRVAENVISDKEHVVVPSYDHIAQKMVYNYFDKNDSTVDFSDVRFVKTEDQLFLTSISHLRLARSKNGVDFIVDDSPFMSPSEFFEEFGIEDPRIVPMNDQYYITYSAISSSGVKSCLAVTKDFIHIDKNGIIFLCDNKDVVLFPEKINGYYYALNRPVSAYFQRPEIWISKSNDLLGYYDHKRLAMPRKNHFDSARLGASLVPIKTNDGWLEIYHGANDKNEYTIGAMLLDLNDPSKLLKRSTKPFIYSIENYEKNGFMPNVIFPCGHILKEDMLHIYYGNCDENICLLTLNINDIINELKPEE